MRDASNNTLNQANRIYNVLARLAISVEFWFALNVLLSTALLLAHFLLITASPWWPDWFAVLTNLLIGGLTSFLFYYLIVYYPGQRRKHLIKNNLKRMYRSIKLDILWQIVFASIKGGRTDLKTDIDVVESLMAPATFKAKFEKGREADEGFYAFQNQMSSRTSEFQEIVLNLRLLSKQIGFVLQNYDMDNPELFNFFKRLEVFLLKLQSTEPGYDESKGLCRFIWEIYAGWNFIEGDLGYDIIDKMIADI